MPVAGPISRVRECSLERRKVFALAIFALAPQLAERRWMVLPACSRAELLKFRCAYRAYPGVQLP